MSVNAQSAPQSQAPRGPGGPPVKRRLRNYLLDARFQLKYTSYVVIVTLLVAGTLGYLAYQQSRAQTEMLTIGWAMQGQTEDFIEEQAREYDRNLLLAIVGGVLLMTFALGVTGILVTHKIVGPAYKLKRLMQDVYEGHLKLQGRLRKGDELQDVFLVFEKLINKMRRDQQEEIDLLSHAIERARSGTHTDEVLRDLETLRTRMEKELE